MVQFEFDGEQYKEASKHQKEWGNSIISELKLFGDEIILDLGCGDGILTQQLSNLVPNGKVIGIDASVGMIDTAKKLEKDNLTFICMDIDNIDFVEEIDLIFSNAALHWIKDHKSLLRNCSKALKTNGIIKWNFAGYGNCLNFFDTVKDLINKEIYKGYFSNFEWPWFMPSKGEYEKLIEEACFSNINIEYENADRFFSNSDEMIRWIDQPSLVPFLSYIHDSNKVNFRNEVIDIMIEKTKQPDGRCFETFRRINVKASK